MEKFTTLALVILGLMLLSLVFGLYYSKDIIAKNPFMDRNLVGTNSLSLVVGVVQARVRAETFLVRDQ